ncbi:hypothetical protein GCM10022225_32150 [Plantactinospora mayteni]|uniref:Uncharacterized protein n=1 Tax=Plantactinospora mayteni TaxID=566021 RepID=A0ABQ4ELL8_9ACTN|nr:hypothetical protein Pma05_21940 [Plantactinospora mayteni]
MVKIRTAGGTITRRDNRLLASAKPGQPDPLLPGTPPCGESGDFRGKRTSRRRVLGHLGTRPASTSDKMTEVGGPRSQLVSPEKVHAPPAGEPDRGRRYARLTGITLVAATRPGS